jgi:SAM-dependent methyltransferase
MTGGACPNCRHGELRVFFEGGEVPVYCNVPATTREEALSVPRGRIRLGFCDRCAMIHNVAFDARLVDYAPEYENSLHFSDHFQRYAEALADDLIDRFSLRGKTVVELGCGKGEFLALLCDRGVGRAIGFDPSFDGEVPRPQGIEIIPDRYSGVHATQYAADLVCSRHVLEHLEDHRSFLDATRAALRSSTNAAVYFEVPNGLYTLRDLGIWDIIYEHCSYFTEPSLSYAFQAAGFTSTGLYSTYGQQFLCIEARPSPVSKEQPPAHEARWPLGALAEAFSARHREKLEEWTLRLKACLEKGHRIAVWGAGSKGVTFLNSVPGGSQISFVVDVNPRKQGRYVPGTGQEIVPPGSLAVEPPDIIVLMNALYRPEIEAALARLGLAPMVVAA